MEKKETHPLAFANKFCTFTYKDGRIKKGVFAAFFEAEPNRYYFVSLMDIIEFKTALESGDDKTMRKLATPLNITEISMIDFIE